MNVQIFSKVVKQVTIYNVVKPMAFLRLVRPEWSHKKNKRFTILEGFLSAITFSLLSGLG